MNKETCPICGEQTDQDGKWPIANKQDEVVQGCYECFEKQSDEMWWDMVIACEIVQKAIKQ